MLNYSPLYKKILYSCSFFLSTTGYKREPELAWPAPHGLAWFTFLKLDLLNPWGKGGNCPGKALFLMEELIPLQKCTRRFEISWKTSINVNEGSSQDGNPSKADPTYSSSPSKHFKSFLKGVQLLNRIKVKHIICFGWNKYF